MAEATELQLSSPFSMWLATNTNHHATFSVVLYLSLLLFFFFFQSIWWVIPSLPSVSLTHNNMNDPSQYVVELLLWH